MQDADEVEGEGAGGEREEGEEGEDDGGRRGRGERRQVEVTMTDVGELEVDAEALDA